MPAKKQPGLIFLWSSGTRWSGNQSYTAVPKSTSQITCALWPLFARGAAKGLSDLSPRTYCRDSLRTRRRARKEQGRQLSKQRMVSRVVTAWKSFHRIVWLKQRCERDNHPQPSRFHPTASSRKQNLRKRAAIPKNVQCQNKAPHWSSATPFLSSLLRLHFAVPWPWLLRKSTLGNSALSWCKYISLW